LIVVKQMRLTVRGKAAELSGFDLHGIVHIGTCVDSSTAKRVLGSGLIGADGPLYTDWCLTLRDVVGVIVVVQWYRAFNGHIASVIVAGGSNTSPEDHTGFIRVSRSDAVGKVELRGVPVRSGVGPLCDLAD